MTVSSWVVIVAGGKEEMLSPEICTAFLNLQNKPILSYSLTACEHCPEVESVVIVAPKDRMEQVVSVVQLFGCHKVRKIVPGGSTQYASFTNGMKYVDDDAKIVVMHEVSRPGIMPKDLTDVIKTAKKHGYAMVGRPLPHETATINDSSVVDKFLESKSIWSYGTPMGFSADVLKKALATVTKKKKPVKTLLEAMALSNQSPRLVESVLTPHKINSLDQYREIERLGLPAS